MSSSSLFRWSGLAALVGGGLFVVANIAESLLFAGQPHSEAAATGAWILVQGLYVAASVLISLGLVGLYLRQSEQTGVLGLIAFLMAFTGAALAIGSVWSEAFFGAWLAQASPELLDSDPSAALVAGVILSYALFALGWFLFGLVSLRAGVVPRAAAILLMIGTLLFLVVGIMELPFAGVLYGAAVAWMGFALWSGIAPQPLITEPAT